MTSWTVARGEQRWGPLTDDQLRQLLDQGRLAADDLLWAEGTPSWVRADQVFPSLVAASSAPAPPSTAVPPATTGAGPSMAPPIGTPTPPPGAAPGTSPPQVVTWAVVTAAVSALVGAVLPWIGEGPFSANGFDFRFAYLWDHEQVPDGEGLTLGLVAVALGGAALLGLVPALRTQIGLVRAVGAAMVALSVLFLFSWFRTVNTFADSMTEFFDTMRFGAVLVGVGGVVLLVAAGGRATRA